MTENNYKLFKFKKKKLFISGHFLLRETTGENYLVKNSCQQKH